MVEISEIGGSVPIIEQPPPRTFLVPGQVAVADDCALFARVVDVLEEILS